MKSQDTEAALRELALVAPPEISVVCVQNGVENERLVLRRFRHVYGALVICPAIHLQPGVIESRAAPKLGILDLGRYPHGIGRAESIAALLRRAGYLSNARQSIMDWKCAKLLQNLQTTLTALVGPAAAGSPLSARLRAEGEAALRAARIPFTCPADFAQRRAELTPHWSGSSTGSSWQSLERGTGSIEADYLNGEIVLQGTTHGVQVPANAVVQSLARELTRKMGRPGTITLEAVERAVDARARRE
jgi:2-dehydropantoate 2-reductase